MRYTIPSESLRKSCLHDLNFSIGQYMNSTAIKSEKRKKNLILESWKTVCGHYREYAKNYETPYDYAYMNTVYNAVTSKTTELPLVEFYDFIVFISKELLDF